jgi:hypothetical protein
MRYESYYFFSSLQLKHSAGHVYVHFHAVLNMEELELDDSEAFENAPPGVDPRDVIWVIFVLKGAVPELPDGFFPVWVTSLKGSSGHLSLMILVSDTEYVHLLYVLIF